MRGGGGASELELLSGGELGAALEDELGRRFDEEDERGGGASDEDEGREEELRRCSELGRSAPELELERSEGGRFAFEELERSDGGRLELELLERRRLPSRDEDEEEDEDEERRRATGVSQ